MQNFLIYILEVSVLTSIFFLFYRYLYFKLAYFVWSRYYFFAFLLLSFVIPLLPTIFNSEAIIFKIDSIIGVSKSESFGLINVENSYLNNPKTFWSNIPLKEIFFIVWLSGFIRYVFIIIRSIISVLRLKSNSKKIKEKGFTLIFTNSENTAFSFSNNIFVNKNFETLNDEEKNQILRHEKIHAKQKHTIDNLIFEIFRAVFWFNPVSRLISANIKIIHEFIVDNELTGNKNAPDYSRLILKLSTHCSHAISVSSFSKDEIKSRIKLITFPEKEKVRKIRFAISIPVLLATVFAMWIIVSTTNEYVLAGSKTNKEFCTPFEKGNYKLISPFFENMLPGEVMRGKEENINKALQYTISHKEATYEVKDYSKVYAIGNGKVSHIKRKDIFGLTEITIIIELETGDIVEYIGLYKTTIKENDKVNKGDIIGLTGDLRLYPSVSIKLMKDGKYKNPENIYQ
ncbi:MAG: peptidoglycan DD-metalloendopeptidase family protein [Bacteroidales bacterium]|nr:peptidoglycan DD-metalloendopeptidase family protein [Bacteroidales bacterium]